MGWFNHQPENYAIIFFGSIYSPRANGEVSCHSLLVHPGYLFPLLAVGSGLFQPDLFRICIPISCQWHSRKNSLRSLMADRSGFIIQVEASHKFRSFVHMFFSKTPVVFPERLLFVKEFCGQGYGAWLEEAASIGSARLAGELLWPNLASSCSFFVRGKLLFHVSSTFQDVSGA